MTPHAYRTAVDRHLEAAARHRNNAEELVSQMEALVARFTALEVVPLDVLDRAERLLVQWHVANQLRLWTHQDEIEAGQ